MTVKELRKVLAQCPDEFNVVFQANEPGEEDEGTDKSTHTFAIGNVFSVFIRPDSLELVIDGAITNRE